MADLARADGTEPETQPIWSKPSPTVLEVRERIGCAHVHDGAPVAGFVSVSVQPSMGYRDFTDQLVDVCAECLRLAQDGAFVAVSYDRRRGRRQSRPSSSVVEQPADNRQVAAKTTTEEPSPDGESAAVEASGSIPAMGSTLPDIPMVTSWDEHR